ncbi:MAG: element excision factor XisI family protein, partial [Prochlorothrix sp.]
MDRVDHYHQSILAFLERYADAWKDSDVETQLVIDAERHHYMLLRVGWEGNQRVNHPVFQFDIKDGKIVTIQGSTKLVGFQPFDR